MSSSTSINTPALGFCAPPPAKSALYGGCFSSHSVYPPNSGGSPFGVPKWAVLALTSKADVGDGQSSSVSSCSSRQFPSEWVFTQAPPCTLALNLIYAGLSPAIPHTPTRQSHTRATTARNPRPCTAGLGGKTTWCRACSRRTPMCLYARAFVHVRRQVPLGCSYVSLRRVPCRRRLPRRRPVSMGPCRLARPLVGRHLGGRGHAARGAGWRRSAR